MSETKRECVEKPPLGVMPRWCWIELRIKELRGAIILYLEAGKPAESVNPWLCEIFNLEQEIKNNQGCPVTTIQGERHDYCRESWEKLKIFQGCETNGEMEFRSLQCGYGSYSITFEEYQAIWQQAIAAARQHGAENV